jgi:pyruvate,water dikinase
MEPEILWFKECSYENKHLVGGKTSSLGELYNLSQEIGYSIGDGFALTTNFYDNFIKFNNIDENIKLLLNTIDYTNIHSIECVSEKIKTMFINGHFTGIQKKSIKTHFNELCQVYGETLTVAVRSSALAEDLPDASFAGQHDTYLNVSEESLICSIKKCLASLFNSRAISYRKTHNIPYTDVKLSIAIQKMIRSDCGVAGVAFSLDPETGYNKAIVINSSYGLGESVVSGCIKPDEFILNKQSLNNNKVDPLLTKTMGDKITKIIYDPINSGVIEVETSDIEKQTFSLTDQQLKTLGTYILKLEKNYSKLLSKKTGIDVEWAIDGIDQSIYIIQTRPETIFSNQREKLTLSNYILDRKGDCLVKGVAVGDKISSGRLKIIKTIKEATSFEKGDILVTDMTTPDWEPIMKLSSGMITNKGGRTCHAAIVARELGLNAVVGCGQATTVLKTNTLATISCCEGETGLVYNDCLPYHIETFEVSTNLKLPVNIMLNVGNPESAFENSLLPNSGVGLARLEFIISNYIKIHPLALVHYPNVPLQIKEKIETIINNSTINGKTFFIQQLARGMSKIASSFYPNDVIVRLSDFKSNEYKNLIGGELYEPCEENPMLGWRGASRYYSKEYKDAFQLECEAILYARNTMNMKNIVVMIPFCRTPQECQLVIETMSSFGLRRGENDLKLFLMCEIPSNVIEADKFSPMLDGVSIGGNDLLQLTLGVDRDSDKLAYLSDHTNTSYRRLISMAIQNYKKFNVKVGFCGQQPSDSIDFCRFLIEQGIDSISVTPDSLLKTLNNLTSF